MLLFSDDFKTTLIGAKIEGDSLVAGLFYAERSERGFEIVSNPSKQLVYKVFMPDECKKAIAPITGCNVKLKVEKIG